MTRIEAVLAVPGYGFGGSDGTEPIAGGGEVGALVTRGRGGGGAAAGAGAAAVALEGIAKSKVYPKAGELAYLRVELSSRPHSFSIIASCSLSQSRRV
ncbi:hypothetical protein M407DRAFT_244490 [Tulasnella calospora MUT 4182]|uniref:Uncharacterized protein n=1 Tax=Tulasnella calospora MUT 4182 TaxID=1051891 RepID=A0A0C3QG29_9AGAM|nr:hypothetical protein M407DRAFT_244490 [Tulasnella calospora MUT 4182]